jgi:type II secretory pathway pseudopilin PulG
MIHSVVSSSLCARKVNGRRTRAGDRRRNRNESGMTLVEVIVSVALIVVVTVPLGLAFYKLTDASSANAGRQNASVLASTILSRLDSTTFADVGFTQSNIASAVAADSSYATLIGGTTYKWHPNNDYPDNCSSSSSSCYFVRLATVTTPPSFTVGTSKTAFAPIMTKVVFGGQTFTVYTHVAWHSAVIAACGGSTTTISGAYLRAWVEVIWSTGSIGKQYVYQDKLIYPGGLAPVSPLSSAPAAPTNVTAKAQSVSGEVEVSWQFPTATSSTVCFKVGWSDPVNNEYSSGFLTEAPAATTPCPSVTGAAPPTYFVPTSTSISSSGVPTTTATYCATGLIQGGAGQVYSFYVTAYSLDGTASAESSEVGATSPLGPIITSVTDSTTGAADGLAGDTLTLDGYDLSTTDYFSFCATSSSSCSSPFSGGCATSTRWCVTPISCPTQNQCTVKVPTITGASSGTWYVIAESVGSQTITSAPQSVNAFTYDPVISGATVAPAGGQTTITGTNLYQYNTTFHFGTVVASTVVFSPGGTTAIVTVPAAATSTALTAVDNGIQSNTYTYTY